MHATFFLRVACMLAIAFVMSACATMQTSATGDTAAAQRDALFAEQWNLIQHYALRALPDTEQERMHCQLHLAENDLAGCLGDVYAKYLDPKKAEAFALSKRGLYEGIGIEASRENDGVIVHKIFPDTPAARSGAFQNGDVIVEIDGISTASCDLEAVSIKLRDAEGTQVIVVLMREGVRMEPVMLIRELVRQPSVEVKHMEEGILYIGLQKFNTDTHYDYIIAIAGGCLREGIAESSHILRDCTADKMKTPVVIADARDNSGGSLTAAEKLCGFYAARGDDVIVTLQGRTQEITHRAAEFLDMQAIGVLRGIPLIVMVNEQSASATEIFAECVRQKVGALIVGVRTDGKGTTQGVFPLSNNGIMMFTIEEYFVDNSRTPVQGIGVTPDIEIRAPDDCTTCVSHRGDPAYDFELAVTLEHARALRDMWRQRGRQ